jgi:hypothetical protein
MNKELTRNELIILYMLVENRYMEVSIAATNPKSPPEIAKADAEYAAILKDLANKIERMRKEEFGT